MVRTLVKVEDIDIALEQEHYDTCMQVYVYDGSGKYNADGTKRLIVWVDPDDEEYPYQHDVWYPVGTLIPLDIR